MTKYEAWGIMHPDGNLWSVEIFDSKEEAEKYMDKKHMQYFWDLSKHTAVRVQVSIKVLKI